MKVKKSYLAALVLPLAFAACSEEELVPNVPTVSLEDRETFDLVLNATKPSLYDGATRLSINEDDQFVWEKGTDVVGAALADGETFQTINNKIFLNYPFTANDNATMSSFSGKSAVVYGTYFFHFPYVDHLNRGTLSMDFPSAQKYTVPAEEGDLTSLQQAVKGMKLVSPLYEFAEGVTFEDAATTTQNVDFDNLYSVVKVNIIPSNMKIDANVEEVTLSANTTEFISEATLNAVVLPVIDGTENAEALKVDKEAFYAMIMDQTIYDIDERAPIVLTVNGQLTLKNGEETAIYMLVPKGIYADGLKLTVHTSEGVYTRDITKTINLGIAKATNDAEDVDVEGDKILRIDAAMNFALDGTGNVILPTEFTIDSDQKWINAVSFLENHAIAYINKPITFKLTKDVKVANLPAFKLTINGNNTLTLNSDYTITSENVDQFNATGVTLVMPAGKTLTLNVPMTGFKAIENNGTLNVNASQGQGITNFGTMNIAGTVVLGGTINNGVAKIGNNPAKPAYINIAAKSVVTAGITNNAGTITLAQGTSEEVTSWVATSTTIGADAAIVVNKNATVTGSLTNTGIITNYGVWAATLTNTDGTFNLESGSVSDGAAVITEGAVVIKDVDDFVGIAAAKAYTFASARVTTEVSTAKAYKNAMTVPALNDVTLTTGIWSFEGAPAAEANNSQKIISQPESGKSLTLSGVTLTFAAAPAAAFDMTLKGANKFEVKTVDGVKTKTVVKTNNLVVEQDASLVVDSSIEMNDKSEVQSGDATASLKGNVTVEAGAKVYFTEVENKAVLSVKGNTNNLTAGVFGVYSSFQNYSQVLSKQGTHSTANQRVSGKVSQPTNVGDAIFQGNSTSWTNL